MKTILFLLLITSGFLFSRDPVTLKQSEWEYKVKTSTTDTLGSGDSTWTSEQVYLPQHGDPLKYKVYMDVDSIGGTSDPANVYSFFLQARNSEDETYANLDTVTYTGTVDTTFSFTQTTTAQYYKWFRLYVLGSTDELAIEIQVLNWEFYK